MSIDRSHSQVQELVQLVAQQGQITITLATFDDPRIQQLIKTYYGGTALVISGASVLSGDVNTSQTTITGTSSFLNVANLPVTMTMQESAEGVDLTLTYSLPPTWTFSQSFPNLPATWMPAPDLFLSGAQPQSLLNLLTYTNACFVVSTSPTTAQDSQVQLSAGLSFVCHLKLNGILGTIEQMLQIPDSLTLSGPIILPSLLPTVSTIVPPAWPPTRQTTPLSGINLKADVHLDLSSGPVKLTDLFLRIYSPIASDTPNDPYYAPGIYLGGDLQIGDDISVELVAERLQEDSNLMIFTGTFNGLKLPSLSQMANLVGADDLLSSLVPPDPIPSFYTKGGLVSLDALWLCLTFSPFSIQSVGLGIGMDDFVWKPVEDIEIDHLAAQFWVDSPLNALRALNTQLTGTLTLSSIPLRVMATVPDFTISTQLTQASTLPLKGLLSSLGPDFPEFGDLAVDMFSLQIRPGDKSFSVQTMLANQPQPWKIDLGPETLTLSNIRLLLDYAKGSGYDGAMSGSLALAGVQLDASYQYPGPLTLRGFLPSLSLKTLVTQLCSEDITWPSGFDFDLEQSSVLLQEQNSNMSLNVAGEVKDLGLFVLTIQKQTKWGIVLGIDLSLSNLSELPGLGVLAPFESFVGLDALMLVFSSLDQLSGFQFPDLANFNLPSLGSRQVTLPPQANGLSTGLNLYTQLNTTKSGGFQALAKYLGISLDGSVGITLAVSLPDPATNSKFFLSVNEEIQKGTTLVGELGGFLQGSDIGAFLTAVVDTQVQGQPLKFSVLATVLENGVLISGSMQGTIQFDVIHLSNLALVIGIDLEGVPSLGIAATLDVSSFESSLALFFDSADPGKSLVAGALSNLSLLDIARTFAGQTNIPHELIVVLGLVGLKALNAFSMPATTAPLLDQRDVSGISNAFKQYGSVTISSTSDQLLLVINQPGANWHLTDLSTMKHYRLTLQGGQVSVTLEPQLYIAPQMTTLGSLQYPMGFNVIGQIDYLLIQAQIDIQISPHQGITAEVDLAPIVLLNQNFFSITGANSQGGPRFSLSTFAQPQLADAQLRDPHFLLSGTLRLLGADMAGIYLLINEHGVMIKFSYPVNPLVHLDLDGSIDSQGHLALQVGLHVGINRALDLGQLGVVQVSTQVNGTLQAAYAGSAASASFRGGFVFQNISGSIPPLTLNVQTPALRDIEQTLWQQISDIITKSLKDPQQWLSWMHSGVIQGAGQTAEAVGGVLSNTYHLTSNDIATATQKVLGYGSDGVARALKGAGSTPDDTVKALKTLGYQAQEITSTITGVFPHSHADTIVEHVDTPAGPHVDTPTTHADVAATHIDSAKHVDVPRSHIDSSKHIDVSHTDVAGHTITPHGDSNPHTDQTTTPHGDSNPHADQTTTPHTDTSTPHVDSKVPPHGDTSTHVDVKS